MSEIHIPRVAILASGSGTTAEAYAKAIHCGLVSAEIGLVITDQEDAGILSRAPRWNQEYGFDVQTAIINGKTHWRRKQARGQTLEEAEAICTLLSDTEIDLVATLGYMRIVNGDLITEYGFLPDVHESMYQARMVNTHPGPLPQTADKYGLFASQKVLDLGLAASKHTVHVVAQEVDGGPIIAEHEVPIVEGDTKETLNERTQLVEKATIAYALDKFIRERQQYLSS